MSIASIAANAAAAATVLKVRMRRPDIWLVADKGKDFDVYVYRTGAIGCPSCHGAIPAPDAPNKRGGTGTPICPHVRAVYNALTPELREEAMNQP